MVNLKNKKGKLEPTREANTDVFIRENQNLIKQGVRGTQARFYEQPQKPGVRIEYPPIGDFIFKVEIYGSPPEVNWAMVVSAKVAGDVDLSKYNNALLKRTADIAYTKLKVKYGDAFQTSDAWEMLEHIVQAYEKGKISEAFQNINKKTQK